MNIGRAFGFITEDEQWLTKILIGGVLQLIPVVGGLLLYGYVVEIARNAMQGHARPLPRWNIDTIGDTLLRGLLSWVIMFLYSIPIILIALVFAMVVGIVSGGSAAAGDEAGGMVAAVASLCLSLGVLVAMLAVSLVMFAAFVRYIQTDSLSEALKVGEVLAMTRASLGTWVMVLLVSILAGLVSMVGLIACGVGALFTTVYGYAAFGHVLGQVAAQLGGEGGPDHLAKPSSGYGASG
jgi:hypothetical protein